MTRKSRMMENRRIQHARVTAHRMRLMEEIVPYLRARREEMSCKAASHRLRIKRAWRESLAKSTNHMLDVRRKHASTIALHKKRLAEIRCR
ncbi:MAG: hypothetical protein QHG98_01100 [Methanothrix sp.]|jgi:hypothetical protein|uniref:hypothetical protein n=1 Tax=Methanothrix sp. TaxID=90426 RepID=UPI00247BFB50|nr:hypothetical protein [Methanothrix sp.]